MHPTAFRASKPDLTPVCSAIADVFSYGSFNRAWSELTSCVLVCSCKLDLSTVFEDIRGCLM